MKRKLKHFDILDLRPYNSAEEMKQIKSIHDGAIMIVPSNMDEETLKYFNKIKRKRVAVEVQFPDCVRIQTCNGDATLSDAMVQDGTSFFLVNGSLTIPSLSPDKKLVVAINGELIYDQSLASQIEIICCNGSLRAVDLNKTVNLSDFTVLSGNRLGKEHDVRYHCGYAAVICDVPQQACAHVSAHYILTDKSAQSASLTLESGHILQREHIEPPITVKSGLKQLCLSENFLNQIQGQLVLKDIGHVKIEDDVTAGLLQKKILLMVNIHHIKANKKTFDAAQLLAENVEIISK